MDWDLVLSNVGVIAGFCAFILFWLSILMWMMVDSQKRGLWGWVWAFVGLLTGPVGLIAYILFWRNRYEVLPIVNQRDELIRQTSELHRPVDQPDAAGIKPALDEQPETNPTRPPIPRQYQ